MFHFGRLYLTRYCVRKGGRHHLALVGDFRWHFRSLISDWKLVLFNGEGVGHRRSGLADLHRSSTSNSNDDFARFRVGVRARVRVRVRLVVGLIVGLVVGIVIGMDLVVGNALDVLGRCRRSWGSWSSWIRTWSRRIWSWSWNWSLGVARSSWNVFGLGALSSTQGRVPFTHWINLIQDGRLGNKTT
jgi:hypothetical protein